MIKKLLFGILLLLLPAVSWGQQTIVKIYPAIDSSQIDQWAFLNVGDVYFLGWGMQADSDTAKPNILQAWQDSLEKMVYHKIDTTDAVIDSAVGAERAAVAASVDEATSSVWAGRVSDETGTGLWVFGTSPTFTTDITSPLVIGGTATTSDLSLKTTSGVGASGADMHFLVGNNGATEAMTILNNGYVGIGINSPSSILHVKASVPGVIGSHSAGQLIIQNPANSVYANAVITGYESDGGGNPDQQLWYLGGSSGSNSDVTLLNRRNSKLHLGADGATKMTILGDGNVGIGTLNPPERLSVVGNIATGDTATGDVDVYHYFSTDGSWTTEYLKWDDGLGEFQFSDDLVVTGDAYHVTSTETDSQFMSKKYIDDVVAGGGTTNADSIVHIPVEDTTDNIGDLHGLLFDQSADSLLWEEFWATPVTAPTDNDLLKIDTDPDPDTFYWAPSIIRKKAEIQTTDATQTTLISHTLLDENTYHTETQVVAVQSDGTDRASYHLVCTVYRTAAGGATLQGAVTSLHTQESNANLDATFTVSGNDIRVSVTGIVAETWEWGTTITYINISN